MTTKAIKLSAPFELHGKTITEIVLKEPTGGQFLDIGEPFVGSRTSDGGAYFSVEDSSKIRQYLDASIQHENGSEVLRLMSLRDARAVKDGLLSFFSSALLSTET